MLVMNEKIGNISRETQAIKKDRNCKTEKYI